MPVRPAADDEPQALGERGQAPLDRLGMAGVADLEPVEAVGLKLPDLTVAAAVAQMRRDRDAAHRVHQVGHLAQRGQGLLDVGGTPPPQVAAERVVDVAAHATLDQDAGHMGAAERAAVRHRHHVRQLDGHAQPAQVRDDLLGAALARGARGGEKRLEPLVPGRQEVAEQVQLAPGRRSGPVPCWNTIPNWSRPYTVTRPDGETSHVPPSTTTRSRAMARAYASAPAASDTSVHSSQASAAYVPRPCRRFSSLISSGSRDAWARCDISVWLSENSVNSCGSLALRNSQMRWPRASANWHSSRNVAR